MHSFWGFLGMVILFIEMVNYAYADTGREDDEGLRSRVVLEAEEIDSSQVERVQAMADSGHAESGLQAMPDSLSMGTGRMDDRETGKRIAKKLGAGTLGGSTFGFVSGSLMAGSVSASGDGLGQPVIFYFFGLLGYTVGTAVGVSQVDPHDRFVPSLMGSLLGSISGIGLVSMTGNRKALLVCPVASVALAVCLSEGSRNRLAERALKPLEFSRFSISLAPIPRGHLSVVTKLRF